MSMLLILSSRVLIIKFFCFVSGALCPVIRVGISHFARIPHLNLCTRSDGGSLDARAIHSGTISFPARWTKTILPSSIVAVKNNSESASRDAISQHRDAYPMRVCPSITSPVLDGTSVGPYKPPAILLRQNAKADQQALNHQPSRHEKRNTGWPSCSVDPLESIL